MKAELNRLVYACDNVRNRENRYADEYIELNPQDAERRNRDREIYLLAVDAVYYEFKRMLEREEKTA